MPRLTNKARPAHYRRVSGLVQRELRSNSLVGANGLEPSTPTMSRWCSNQLSYAPSLTIAAAIASPAPRTVHSRHMHQPHQHIGQLPHVGHFDRDADPPATRT